MEPLTVRETLAMLESMQLMAQNITRSMNLRAAGGFESSILDLNAELMHARQLLEARAYGQLAPPFNPGHDSDHRPTDKRLSSC